MIDVPASCRAILSLAVTCVVGACTSGAFDSDRPFEHIYVIAAPDLQAPATTLAADLTVTRPAVRPGLDTDRIAVLYPDRRLEYFAGSRWGGTTDVVVQSLLIESLRRATGLRHVQAETSLFSADFVLQTEVARFDAEYSADGGPPSAHIELIVSIGKITDRRPLATFTASGTTRAGSNTLTSVVAAFESAYAQAARTLVERTVATVAGAPVVAPSAQNVESPVASITR